MKVHNCIQGTREWLKLRAGIPTASEFDKIVTPGGKLSKSADPYMFRLLAERLMGHPTKEFISLWMQRGTEMEADAVRFYELQRDLDTVPVGFITNEEGTAGASPDRLVGEEGLLEIKCPSESVHMAYLLTAAGAYETYKVQCQGQLWITRRKWVDIMSFHPELPEALIRIERDDKFIAVLEKEVGEFSQRLETLWQVVQDLGWANTEKQRLEEQLEASIAHLPPLSELLKTAQGLGPE